MSVRNPIMRTIAGGGWLDKPPIASSGCQFVVTPRKGATYALPIGANLRSADFRSATMVYEVNVGFDQIDIEETIVDSNNDVFGFQMSARVAYHIADPLKIVQRNITDTYADIRKLIIASINTITRNCDPDDIQIAQRIVQRKVEAEDGTAAQKLLSSGYALEDLLITLRRDPAKVSRDKQRWEDRANERDEKDRVEHVEKFLRGDLVTRMAYLANLGPEERIRALNELTEIDKQRMDMEMQLNVKILEAGLREIPEAKRKNLFEDVRKQLGQGFSASPIIQGSQPALSDDNKDGTKQARELGKDEEDDWEDDE